MIVLKTQAFLTIMSKVGEYMPLPNYTSKPRQKSSKLFGFIRIFKKLYVRSYLISVAITFFCDLHVLRGQSYRKIHQRKTRTTLNRTYEMTSYQFHRFFFASRMDNINCPTVGYNLGYFHHTWRSSYHGEHKTVTTDVYRGHCTN